MVPQQRSLEGLHDNPTPMPRNYHPFWNSVIPNILNMAGKPKRGGWEVLCTISQHEGSPRDFLSIL